MDKPKRHSFFWPTLLIGVGIVWLLVNFQIIAPLSIGTILQFWPILLVLLGLDILFGRRYAWVGSVFGVLAIAAVIFFLVYGPKTGMTPAAQLRVDRYSEPVAGAASANYDFETSNEAVEISALGDPEKLIDASIAHQGTVNFNVSGTADKTVHLSEDYDTSSWLNWNFSFTDNKWTIGVNPTLPTKITLNGGSGSIDANLTGTNLVSLNADLGSGSSDFTLPASTSAMTVSLGSGSGSVNVAIPANTTVTLTLDSGSGSVNIDIPNNAEVQIQIENGGSGSLNLPHTVSRVSGDVETGVWQTPGFDTAAHKIIIRITDRGSGSISIN